MCTYTSNAVMNNTTFCVYDQVSINTVMNCKQFNNYQISPMAMIAKW